MGILLTLSVRNKDYKEWSGFVVTLVLNGEFDFFPSKLCSILAENAISVLDAYVVICWGGGLQQCLPYVPAAGPSSFSTTIMFSSRPFLGMVVSIRMYMKKEELRNRQTKYIYAEVHEIVSVDVLSLHKED